MQRRATAVSVVLFVLIAAGSFAYIGVAEQPDITVEADRTYEAGDQPEIGGIQYNVTELSDGSATMAWTNESARYTASFENDSNVTYQNDTYRLLVESSADPSTFTLHEQQNVTEILRADDEVYNQTYTSDGDRYVRYRSNDSLQELEAYLPEPRTESFAEGDDYPYQNKTTTVDSVTNTTVTVDWTAVRNNTVSASEGGNVTLGQDPKTTYIAHFPDGNTLVLSQDFEGYRASLEAQSYYGERINGLWGVTLLSSMAAALLIALAWLPPRY